MNEDQQKKHKFYTYLYKKIAYKHANDIRISLIREGKISQSLQFVKVVNYIKGYEFLR